MAYIYCMSDGIYSEYKYERPKKRKKSFFFFTAIIIIAVLVIFFVANLCLGLFFTDKTQSTSVEIPGTEFYASGISSISNKKNALEMAREIRSEGGAGFVDFDGSWFVVTEIVMTSEQPSEDISSNLKFSAEPVTVNLRETAHKELFNSIIQSFEKNALTIHSLTEKPAREAAVQALQLYNELSAAVLEFDVIQGNTNSTVYSEVLIAAQKQLLALFLLSAEKDTANIISPARHCICTIKFAYLELLTSLST